MLRLDYNPFALPLANSHLAHSVLDQLLPSFIITPVNNTPSLPTTTGTPAVEEQKDSDPDATLLNNLSPTIIATMRRCQISAERYQSESQQLRYLDFTQEQCNTLILNPNTQHMIEYLIKTHSAIKNHFTNEQILKIARSGRSRNVFIALKEHIKTLEKQGYTNDQLISLVTRRELNASKIIKSLSSLTPRLKKHRISLDKIVEIVCRARGDEYLTLFLNSIEKSGNNNLTTAAIIAEIKKQLHPLRYNKSPSSDDNLGLLITAAELNDSTESSESSESKMDELCKLRKNGLTDEDYSVLSKQIEELGFDNKVCKIALLSSSAKRTIGTLFTLHPLLRKKFSNDQLAEIIVNTSPGNTLEFLAAHTDTMLSLDKEISLDLIASFAARDYSHRALKRMLDYFPKLLALEFSIHDIFRISGYYRCDASAALAFVADHYQQLLDAGLSHEKMLKLSPTSWEVARFEEILASADRTPTKTESQSSADISEPSAMSDVDAKDKENNATHANINDEKRKPLQYKHSLSFFSGEKNSGASQRIKLEIKPEKSHSFTQLRRRGHDSSPK